MPKQKVLLVKEIANGFHYTESESGVTATRVFIDYDDSEENESERTLTLPKIGDPFVCTYDAIKDKIFQYDIEKIYPTLYCRKVTQKKYSLKVNINIYTVYYTNEITDRGQYFSIDDEQNTKNVVDINTLPFEIESGGQYALITAENNTTLTTWKWEENGNPVYQGTSKLVLTDSFRITRIISATRFDFLLQEFFDLIGCVNYGALTLCGKKYAPGTILLTGINISETIDWNGNKKYKLVMLFEIISVLKPNSDVAKTYPLKAKDELTTPDGWCLIINNRTGTWDFPINLNPNYGEYPTMYQFKKFDELFI
jgi:hypothetical protein